MNKPPTDEWSMNDYHKMQERRDKETARLNNIIWYVALIVWAAVTTFFVMRAAGVL